LHLFDPLALRALTLANRIVVSPMCQYSADDGRATDWHLVHWGQLLQSGAGMFTIEATAVTRDGRITHGCLGLYDDGCEAALATTLARARRQAPAMPVAFLMSCLSTTRSGDPRSTAPSDNDAATASPSGPLIVK